MPTQQETLAVYIALIEREANWQGKLLLSIGMDRTLALAALAAGAATLILENDARVVREAGRDVTFTVTTLDEALRALKNEIRQGRAITVALAGNPQHWLEEIDERGVHAYLKATPNKFVNQTNHIGHIEVDHAETLQERRTRDAVLIGKYPEQRRWLRAAPTLFPRDLTRAYVSDDQRLQPLPQLP